MNIVLRDGLTPLVGIVLYTLQRYSTLLTVTPSRINACLPSKLNRGKHATSLPATVGHWGIVQAWLGQVQQQEGQACLTQAVLAAARPQQVLTVQHCSVILTCAPSRARDCV